MKNIALNDPILWLQKQILWHVHTGTQKVGLVGQCILFGNVRIPFNSNKLGTDIMEGA